MFVSVGDTILITSTNFEASCKDARLCPAINTIGLWNTTDDTAVVISNDDYHNVGVININSGTLDTETINNYWKGAELVALLFGKTSSYREVALNWRSFQF